jgi:uncharacterized protein YbjT (DUF2867 family)
MNLVVGSTGVLGTEVCRRLRQSGQPVRALVRSTSDLAKVNALRACGVEIVYGDLRDEASLRAACAGARCVISTASALSSFSADNTFLLTDLGNNDLIDAAASSGVEQFIFISLSTTLDPDADLKVAKRAIEDHLIKSGINYTILRPTCFMDSWLSPRLGFDFASGRAQIIGEGDAFISYISVADVAQFVVGSIGNPEAHNLTVDLGGPDVVSPLEVVRIAENLTGRTFAVTHIPVEALYAQHAASSNPLEKAFAALMIETTKGNIVPMQDVLRKFPGITLKSVEEYVQEMIGPISAV